VHDLGMAEPDPAWSLYLVRRADDALYTGIALDVERRLAEHRAGRGARALRGRGPLELVQRVEVGPRPVALRLEHRVKQLSKAEKESLVSDPARLDTMVAAVSVELAADLAAKESTR